MREGKEEGGEEKSKRRNKKERKEGRKEGRKKESKKERKRERAFSPKAVSALLYSPKSIIQPMLCYDIKVSRLTDWLRAEVRPGQGMVQRRGWRSGGVFSGA